ALYVHLEEGRVMNKKVDSGQRHSRISEHLAPLPERFDGSDQHRASLVSGADQLVQYAGFGLVLGDVGKVVENQQLEAVEPVDGSFQAEFTSCDLQPLYEIGSSGKHHTPSVLNEGEPDGRGQVALPAGR